MIEPRITRRRGKMFLRRKTMEPKRASARAIPERSHGEKGREPVMRFAPAHSIRAESV